MVYNGKDSNYKDNLLANLEPILREVAHLEKYGGWYKVVRDIFLGQVEHHQNTEQSQRRGSEEQCGVQASCDDQIIYASGYGRACRPVWAWLHEGSMLLWPLQHQGCEEARTG